VKIVPSVSCDEYTGENGPMPEKESRNRNSDAAFGTIFRTSKCFQKKQAEARHAGYKPFAHGQKVLIYFIGLQRKISIL
jgi:hypothetical protein